MKHLWRSCILFIGLGASSSFAAQDTLRDGLLLYYSFDRDGGEVVADESGNGRNARVQGPRWIPDGVSGGAYHFLGEGDWIDASDEGLPAGDDPRAFSWWFSLDGLRPPFDSTVMLNYGAPESYAEFFVLSVDWRIGRDCLTATPWGWVYISNRRIERTHEWHHAVLNYAGNGRYEFYVDGTLCKGTNERPVPIKTRLGGRFRVGTFSVERHGLDGKIDEIRVYNRVLTPPEIAALFEVGSHLVARRPEEADSARAQTSRHAAEVVEYPTPEHLQIGAGREHLNRAAGETSGAKPAAQKNDYSISRIGFSTDRDGDQDVTLFYLDETMHVRVFDVDLDPRETNIQVRVSVYQRTPQEGKADITALLTPQEEGYFHAAVPLSGLSPGSALVDIVGYDMRGKVLRLFRTAPISLKPALGLEMPPPAAR